MSAITNRSLNSSPGLRGRVPAENKNRLVRCKMWFQSLLTPQETTADGCDAQPLAASEEQAAFLPMREAWENYLIEAGCHRI